MFGIANMKDDFTDLSIPVQHSYGVAEERFVVE